MTFHFIRQLRAQIGSESIVEISVSKVDIAETEFQCYVLAQIYYIVNCVENAIKSVDHNSLVKVTRILLKFYQAAAIGVGLQ